MHKNPHINLYSLICCFILIVLSSATIIHDQLAIQRKGFNILTKVMSPYSSLKVSFKFNPLSSIFEQIPQNETFSIVVSSQKMPTVQLFDQVDSVSVPFHSQWQIQQVIYNFENYDLTVSVDLVYEDDQIDSNVNEDVNVIEWPTIVPNQNMIYQFPLINVWKGIQQCLVVSVANEQKNILEKHFVAIIQKQKVANYMLPFNLISLKRNWIFVNHINSPITNTTYANEPFLPTFWNQLNQQALIIPWLPYFSECSGIKKRILLKDLLHPEICMNKEDDRDKISLEMMNPIYCESKTMQFNCLLEEYNVENKRRDEWYASSAEDIFYLLAHPIDMEELKDYFDNPDKIKEITEEMYQEIPVLVTKNIDINQKPQEFVFRFNVALGQSMALQIVSVSLSINQARTINTTEPYYDEDDPLIDRKVALVVLVDYMDNLEKFYHLHESISYYIPIPLVFMAVAVLLGLLIKRRVTIVRNFQTGKFVSLIMVPMFKGLFLSVCTMLSFIMGFYFITKTSSFSIIGTTYDGDDSIESDLEKKYNGRIGLALVMCGLFIIMQVIKQTFKIPTPEQMKINLQDALQENYETVTIESQSSRSRLKSERKIDSLGENDINFIIKTLQSRKSELLLQFFFALVVFEYNYKLSSVDGKVLTDLLIWLLFIPVLATVIYKFLIYFILNDVLYAKAALIVFQAHSYCSFILKADTILTIFFYWFLSVLAFSIITPIYLIKISQFFCRLAKEQHPNAIQIFILKNCNDFIKTQSKLSFYERGISFASILIAQLCSIVLLPFVFAIVQLSFTQSKFFTDIFVNSYNFKIIVFISVSIIPIIIWIVIGIVQWIDKFYDLGIFKVIQLNQFTFKNRKVRWMSDIFRQNPSIADWLKEYEKFHFSSQLYFLLFSLAFAGIAVILGMKIIFENKYICFVDPAMMFMFIIIWSVGNIFSVIISFLAVKFKFYQKKEEVKMRTKLESIEKLVRKKEYTKYLQLNAVKEHFLYSYKDWVIKNIQKIFTKSMFLQDNGRILKKFKFYKNLLKRKNIMKKRNSISEGRMIGAYTKQNEYRAKNSQKELDYEVSEDQTYITVKELMYYAKSKYQESNESKVIKISKQKFNNYARPLLYYWFYTAKQNTLLKSLIAKIREEKLQEVCEFCNMDLDLQNIEKHDCEQIFNKYRVINVGKSFVPDNFVQYYRNHQEFITVCFECKEKKLYLQKKRIKNIKYAKVIAMNWLIRCRSRMLHQTHLKQLKTHPQDHETFSFKELNIE